MIGMSKWDLTHEDWVGIRLRRKLFYRPLFAWYSCEGREKTKVVACLSHSERNVLMFSFSDVELSTLSIDLRHDTASAPCPGPIRSRRGALRQHCTDACEALDPPAVAC